MNKDSHAKESGESDYSVLSPPTERHADKKHSGNGIKKLRKLAKKAYRVWCCAERKVSVCSHTVCHVQQYKETMACVTKNLKVWCLFAISLWIVGKGNFPKALATFFVMLFLVYFVHLESHNVRNFITISHHYHHEQNNWLSHGIQILLEMQFGLFLPIVNELLLGDVLDRWVIILLYIFYTTVHNINYSLFHVNRTHELHHENIFTNIGPDICDALFQTKNQANSGDDGYIEDIGHYGWNIVIGTIVVLFLRYLYNNPMNKLLMDGISYATLIFISIVILLTNTYLTYFYTDPAASVSSATLSQEDSG